MKYTKQTEQSILKSSSSTLLDKQNRKNKQLPVIKLGNPREGKMNSLIAHASANE